MKKCLLLSFIVCSYNLLFGQIPVSQIEGFMEVFHPLDTTSIYVGKSAGKNIDPSAIRYNSFFGTGVGQSTTTGDYNSFFGNGAGRLNTTGIRNNFFGAFAGFNNLDGFHNCFFGDGAGSQNTSGSDNSFFGHNAGILTLTGGSNSFFGASSGELNKTGHSNIFLGKRAGYNNDNGYRNSFLGEDAGDSNKSGHHNTIIGNRADLQYDSLEYASAIGAEASVSTSNTMVLGRPVDGVAVPGNIAIGQSTPVSENEVRLKVGGNTLARGYLDLSHASDTTSIFIGKNAGKHIDGTSNSKNTFVGNNAGKKMDTQTNNSFFGYNAGREAVNWSNSFFGAESGLSTTFGPQNSFFGHRSGLLNTQGAVNSFFGLDSGLNNTTGSLNTFVGSLAGYWNKKGSYNVSLGFNSGADPNLDSLLYTTAIGAESRVYTDSTIVLGRPADGVVTPGHLVVSQDVPTVHHPNVRLMVMDNNNPTLSIRSTDISTPKIQLTKDPTNANSDWTILMNVPDDNQLQFRHHGNIRLEISDQGRVKIPVLGNAGTITLCRNGSNEIATCSSSIRYKKQVENYKTGLDMIDQLRPVSYQWKETEAEDLGFIAEEIAEIDERLITRNEGGTIEGVKYDRLTTILVNAIKEQQQEIDLLKEQLVRSQNEVHSFEKRLAGLEKQINH